MSTPPESTTVRLDSAGVRRRLADSKGRLFWKSLEDLQNAPEFAEFMHREFPEQASEFDDPKGRREFLTIMGASLALAGLTGCTRQPDEKIVPYVKKPEEVVPGRPLFFATAVLDGGYAKGVLVESHEGRPTKIEGNPDHPASLGATDVFGQASVLQLYDPDRSQAITFRDEIRTWSGFLAAMRLVLDGQRGKQGAGIRILTETVTSPTLYAQLQDLLKEFPAARWYQYDPVDAARGQAAAATYRFEDADVVVSLEADFVGAGPGNLRWAREYTARRKKPTRASMNRLYVAESTPSLTGGIADHRFPMRPSEILGFAGALAAALGAQDAAPGSGAHAAWVAAVAKDLQAHPGRSLVLAGATQPPAVHAIAHAINTRLGNVGRTVSYTASPAARPADSFAEIRALTDDMRSGRVDVLFVLGGNPVYTAPADLDFAGGLNHVPLRVHLGLYDDETAELCHWHIPEAHSLEAWSDARAYDGTLTILQPLIAPLYSGKSIHEMLGGLSKRPDRSGHDVVKDYWRTQLAGGAAFEPAWRKALHDGLVSGQPLLAEATPEFAAPAAPAPAAGGLEIIFRADPTVHDGRYANLGWLQEVPKPITKIAWDNAALMSPATAQKIGVANADVVTLSYRGRTVQAPVWTMPGHPEDAVSVYLGGGRTRAGRVGNHVGFDAYSLRTSDAPWFGSGLQVTKAPGKWPLASTQEHWTIDKAAEDRHTFRSVSVEEYEKEPQAVREMMEEPKPDDSLFPAYKYGGHKWGMAIDLGSCVGCNACVVACQAENNIPVVGKEQVLRGREMHWIRVDRYYSGNPEQAESVGTHFQPVPCMHCENAPCEQVCPVAATTHSDEGLNDMVYNRCIGTRYCSNNCPYKVRRFNFLLFQDFDTPSLKLQRNPDVTVRSRGVMEKCTYCVQRIQKARIDARNESRPIAEGEIKTACQSVCPTEAIVFGDLNDPGSAVARMHAEPRTYGLLADLNTRPRTRHMAEVKNPNPEVENG